MAVLLLLLLLLLLLSLVAVAVVVVVGPRPAAAQGGGGGAAVWRNWSAVGSLPHDPQAFTQGLLFRAESGHGCACGCFYESTGLTGGASSLRRVRAADGAVLALTALPGNEFGEGLAAVPTDIAFPDYNNANASGALGPFLAGEGEVLLQLTWQNRVVHRWPRCGFPGAGAAGAALPDLANPPGVAEGWGLAWDAARGELAYSDGSATLRFVDPATMAVVRSVTVVDGVGGAPVVRLNELEWIRGEVWANVWQTDNIVVINPDTGVVRATLDMTGLYSGPGNVLNGIAFDEVSDRIFITGKLWTTIFIVEFPGLLPPAPVPAPPAVCLSCVGTPVTTGTTTGDPTTGSPATTAGSSTTGSTTGSGPTTAPCRCNNETTTTAMNPTTATGEVAPTTSDASAAAAGVASLLPLAAAAAATLAR